MPVEMPELVDDDQPRRRLRFDESPSRWWRPTSKMGRLLLAAGALAGMGGVIAGYLGTAHALERDARFRIAGLSDIQATGLGEVSRADILPVFGEDVGKNIFFVHLSERRKQLEQIPWVQRATVMRLLPDQIRVSVVERTPIAFVRQGQQIGLVDSEGVLLSMPASGMARHHYSFPVVTGIKAADPVAARRARMAVYQRMIRDLDSTGQHLSQQISEIDLTDPEDARVLMPEQGTDILAHFGDDQFLARYQRYKAHIAEWRQQYPNLAAVDLRYQQQVVLQMTPGSGSTQAAVSAESGKSSAEPPTKPSPAVPAAEHHAAAPTSNRHTSHHGPSRSHSMSARDKKRRAEARRTALAHKKHATSHSAVNRQGQ